MYPLIPRGFPEPPHVFVVLGSARLDGSLRETLATRVAEGSTVVAAPYLATAVAWGEAAGLPHKWLREVFRFAPKPDACYRAQERKKKAAWGKTAKGLGEFSTAAGVVADADEQRRRMIRSSITSRPARSACRSRAPR